MELKDRTIGELVAEDYRRATVFKKHGIDFCCGGGKTLEAACRKRGIDLLDMRSALEHAESGRTIDSARVSSWSPDFLADFIVNEHHAYVRESMPLLREFAFKVARVHGEANPEVIQIAEIFDGLAAEMEEHMRKEERVLFPYVKEMVKTAVETQPASPPPFGSVENPIRMMEHEHDRAGAAMREIRSLSCDFTPPEHACNTYRVLYAKLEEFEDDLHRHVHLENNILFPKILAMEGRA
jgi:regulator of cell morphogenesis and NO signaling